MVGQMEWSSKQASRLPCSWCLSNGPRQHETCSRRLTGFNVAALPFSVSHHTQVWPDSHAKQRLLDSWLHSHLACSLPIGPSASMCDIGIDVSNHLGVLLVLCPCNTICNQSAPKDSLVYAVAQGQESLHPHLIVVIVGLAGSHRCLRDLLRVLAMGIEPDMQCQQDSVPDPVKDLACIVTCPPSAHLNLGAQWKVQHLVGQMFDIDPRLQTGTHDPLRSHS